MKEFTLLMLLAVLTISLQAQEKVLSRITQSLVGEKWTNVSGTNYKYNSMNLLASETELSWVDENWKIAQHIDYSTDISNEKMTMKFVKVWNKTTNSLENSYHTQYIYKAEKLIEIKNFKYTPTVAEDTKILIAYKTNNLPDVVSYYRWSGTQWINEERTTYTYNATNNLISYVDEKWVETQWINAFKTIYTYNSNNKLVTKKNAKWDEFNTMWVEDSKIAQQWDVVGNKQNIEEITNRAFREEYTYDISMLMTSFAHPFIDKTGFEFILEEFPHINKVLTTDRFTYNVNTEKFEIKQKTSYNYDNAITVGVDSKLVARNLVVRPAPIQDESKTATETATETKTETPVVEGKNEAKENEDNTDKTTETTPIPEQEASKTIGKKKEQIKMKTETDTETETEATE